MSQEEVDGVYNEKNDENNHEVFTQEQKKQVQSCSCDSSRRFGLVFPFVEEEGDMQKLLHGGIPLPTLDFSIGNNQAKRRHSLLEADNILSLNVLRNTHYGKVDVIYVDPPYNTGNKDFTYNDRYIEKEDTFKHSKWLSFMKPRLELARDLLKPDGFIALSIDDNEYATLKLLCDQVFGENNFVGTTVWKSRASANDAKHFAVLTEYILMYAKDKTRLSLKQKEADSKGYKLRDEFFEERGAYALDILHSSSITYSKSMDYPIVFEGKTYYAGGVTREEWESRQAQNLNGKKGHHLWRWGQDQLKFGVENGLIVAKGGKLYTKRYFKVNKRLEPEDRTLPYTNLIPTDEHSSSQGTNDMKNIFGAKVFSYPKPVGLVQRFISMHPNKNALVLDFFAGSGTTGQAVLDLNREDGGSRTFILATNNFEQDGVENGIARGITAERIRRIIQGERAVAKNGENEPYHDDALDYYVVDTVNVDDINSIDPSEWSGLLALENSVNPTLTVVDSDYARVENGTEVHVLFANSESVELGDDFVYDILRDSVKKTHDGENKELHVYIPGDSEYDMDIELDSNLPALLARRLPRKYVQSIQYNVERMKLG